MKIAVLAAILAGLALALPGFAFADSISAQCTAAGVTSSCSSGWYRTDVTVSFILPGGSSNPQGCGDQTISSDTTGDTITCTVAVAGSQCCRLDVTIKRDATPPTATAITAQRGPDANGWYNHPVGISVSGTDDTSGIAACTSTTYAGPDSASASITGQCVDNAGNVSATKTLTIQYDGTAPSMSAAPARAADSNGWYNHPVAVAFQGSDAVSGIDSCTSATYSGPDGDSAAVAGSCKDRAGNTATASVGLHYDATPPTVTGAVPDRAPDLNGWYNHAVSVTFQGSDAASGIASCDKVTYDKPTTATAQVTGRCHDAAGNVSQAATFGFRYDSTPPKIAKLTADPLNGQVSLAWTASADVSAVKILRSRRGAKKPLTLTLYSGKRITKFTDRRVHNGSSYTYVVEAFDQAGNSIVGRGTVTPSASAAPAGQATTAQTGSVLRWSPAAGATYYNVQLWRDGRKVLTTWPTVAALTLPRLPAGHYVWLVWPGFGSRAEHRYGALIGRSTLVVKP